MTAPTACEAHGAPMLGTIDTLAGVPLATLWADGCLAWLRDPNGCDLRDVTLATTAAEVAAATCDAIADAVESMVYDLTR